MRLFLAAAQKWSEDIQAPLMLPEEGSVEMREVARLANQMQRSIRRQLDERTEIVAAISHDLQTPITRLRLRADQIDDPALQHKFVHDLDGIASMIREGLDYARSAQLREKRVAINLTVLAESLADQMSDLGHTVQVQGTIERPYTGALRALERALLNLLTNAIKFGGSARLVLDETAEAVCIRVIDPGLGVPTELLGRVFEPFFRIESGSRFECEGTGLGLSITRNLIRAHGGDVTLANVDGGGFEATLTLPKPRVL